MVSGELHLYRALNKNYAASTTSFATGKSSEVFPDAGHTRTRDQAEGRQEVVEIVSAVPRCAFAHLCGPN